MFEISFDNQRVYKVIFQNAQNVPFDIPSSTDDDPRSVVRNGIYAHILVRDANIPDGNKPEWQFLFSGFAAAHPKQHVRGSKNVGRKVALARALHQSNFNRVERRLFWGKYALARGGKLS